MGLESDFSYKPPVERPDENTPIGNSKDQNESLQSKKMGETENKTAQTAEEKGLISPEMDKTEGVIVPKKSTPAASHDQSPNINPDEAASSVRKNIAEGKESAQKVAAVESSQAASSSSSSKENQNDGSPIDKFIEESWLPEIVPYLPEGGPEVIQEYVKQVREYIQEVKEEYRETHIVAERSVPANREFQRNVSSMMKTGSLKPVDGGKGGVYFLLDSAGTPKFVVKPFDEDMLTLNNPKHYATPYIADDGQAEAKPGVPLYSAVRNEMMTGIIAKELGLERCVPKSQVMILSSQNFHDITDGIDADPHEIADKYGAPDREKLCIVQEFIPDSSDTGELLVSNFPGSQEEIEEMSEEERHELELTALPNGIDQEMYEEAIILALVCGETDGNAGNFLLSKIADPDSGQFSIIKIDNAATFTETNTSVASGYNWLLKCAEQPLSPHAKEIIKNIDADRISSLMSDKGLPDEAIDAMKQRVEVMNDFAFLEENRSIGLWASEVEDMLFYLNQTD